MQQMILPTSVNLDNNRMAADTINKRTRGGGTSDSNRSIVASCRGDQGEHTTIITFEGLSHTAVDQTILSGDKFANRGCRLILLCCSEFVQHSRLARRNEKISLDEKKDKSGVEFKY